jgi:glutamyl-tRNA synthetase
MEDADADAGIADFWPPTGAPRCDFAGAERRLRRAMYCLKDRAALPELLEKAHFLLAERPIEPDEKAARRSMMYPVVYCQN